MRVVDSGRPAGSEEQQVDAAIAGDAAASRSLVEQVAPAVSRAVRRVVGPTDPDADDLTQDALVAFVRALPAHRRGSSIRGFATTIASNIALSALRKRRRKRRLLDAFAVRPDPRPADSTSRRHRMVLLRETLATLPHEQAETVVLRLLLGHSLAEVASMTGVPINTVRSRVRLARASLMRQLAKHPTWAHVCERPEEGA